MLTWAISVSLRVSPLFLFTAADPNPPDAFLPKYYKHYTLGIYVPELIRVYVLLGGDESGKKGTAVSAQNVQFSPWFHVNDGTVTCASAGLI